MLGNKRTADGALEESKKKLRSQEESLDGGPALEQKTRFLLQNHEAGAVIGKGGNTVNSIRTSTGCSVNILKNESKVGPYAKQRILVLGGSVEAKNMAVQMMVQQWLDLASDRAVERGEPAVTQYTVKILIHKFQAGVIIGKGGADIRQLQADTEAHMQISKDPLPGSTERVLTVSGSIEQLTAATERVLAILSNNPPRPGTSIPFDPSMSQMSPFGMGGYGGGYGHPRQMMPSPNQGYSGHNQGYQPYAAASGGGVYGGSRQNRSGTDGQSNSSSSRMDGGASMDSGMYGGMGDNGDGAGASCQKILIASNMAGRIIGKGGATIRELNHQSGTRIQISKQDPSDPNERLVTVTGPPANISTAVYLISQLLQSGPGAM